jgi:hypothetical protein
MPRAKIVRRKPPKYASLKEALLNEWLDPKQDSKEPIIIEDTQKNRGSRHLFVIWEAWKDLNQEHRSEMIMDVYENLLKKQNREKDIFDVTVAMGLTAEEAQRLGIAYEIEKSA